MEPHGFEPQVYTNLVIATTGLVTAVTALLVAIKTWWEVCKAKDSFLKEARHQIKQHNQASVRAAIGEQKTADLEAAQMVKRVDAEQMEIEYQEITHGRKD